MVDPAHTFYIADYAVFVTTIVISIGIGIFYALKGGGQKTTSSYLVGERKMTFLPVAISLVVSYESSIMMLGLPAETYVYGIQWWLATVGYLFSNIISVFMVVPLLHPLKITSAYEYLELRYKSRAVRLFGSFLGIANYLFYMGIVLFGPAIALEAVTGFPQWSSIFVIAFVAILYTAIGGLKAVIWTDVFQAFIMYAGMFAILIKGTLDVGSASKVWNLASEGGRLNFFNFDPDPTTRHTFWNLFVGSLFRGVGLAFNQSTVQRVSSTRTQREAKMVLFIMAPCFFLSLTMACYEGIVAYAYYETKGCDPLASGKITNPNQVIPFTVMDIFRSLPGMPGLFLASLFSASLSTLSSGLSSISALVWKDFLQPCLGDSVSELQATIIAKISVVVFGLLGCGVALLVSLIGGPMTQISGSLLAAFSGPLSGLFIVGMFCPWGNAKGVLTGGAISLVVSSWIALGKSFAKNVKRQPWLPPASTDMCLLANHSDVTTATMSMVMANNTTSSGGSYGFTDLLTNVSYYEFDNAYGFQFGGGDHYYYTASTVSAAMETTTPLAAALEDDGPQGIESIYKLSYMWFGPMFIFGTVLVSCFFSLLFGGNKKGDVDPRYLLPFCDYVCCCLPECVRRVFRCADLYSKVELQDLPPIHDNFMDTETTITQPANGKPGEDSSTPTIIITSPAAGDEKGPGVDGIHVATGSDENAPEEIIEDGKQNGDTYHRYSVPGDADGFANANDNEKGGA